MPEEITEKIKTFFARYAIQSFGKGELILFADDTVPPVSYLLQGRVTQYDVSDDGNKVVLNVFKPGAFFPMSCAVNNKPNKYFFEALEVVEVRQAPASDAVAFLRHEPDVLFNLLQRLYSGTDGLLGRMSLLMDGTAQSRLLYELSVTADRFGERRPDGSTAIKITEAQLAHQTGLARETVSRTLKKCAEKGMLTVGKGMIVLLPR